MDGLRAHYDPEALAVAKEHNIIVSFIPPHTSHKTQPLDRCAFSSFKAVLGAHIRTAMVSLRLDEKLSKHQLAGLAVTAYYKAFTPETIQASF